MASTATCRNHRTSLQMTLSSALNMLESSHVSVDDSVFDLLLVEISTRLERWLWLELAARWNQYTSLDMIAFYNYKPKSAHVSLDDSVYDSLHVEISTHLEIRLWLWLIARRNQHTSIKKPVALTRCTLESAHFCRHDRFWQQLVETIERLVRWLCIRRMRVKTSNSKISDWLVSNFKNNDC